MFFVGGIKKENLEKPMFGFHYIYILVKNTQRYSSPENKSMEARLVKASRPVKKGYTREREFHVVAWFCKASSQIFITGPLLDYLL